MAEITPDSLHGLRVDLDRDAVLRVTRRPDPAAAAAAVAVIDRTRGRA